LSDGGDGSWGGNGGFIHIECLNGDIDISGATFTANGGDGQVPGQGGNIRLIAHKGTVRVDGATITADAGKAVNYDVVLKSATKAIRYSQHVEASQRNPAVETFRRLLQSVASPAILTKTVVLDLVGKFEPEYPELASHLRTVLARGL
jgi:hypothetical protein